LGAFPFGKGLQRRVRRAAHEVDLPVAKSRGRIARRGDELDVQPLRSEEAQLHSGGRDEIRWRDDVRDGESHGFPPMQPGYPGGSGRSTRVGRRTEEAGDHDHAFGNTGACIEGPELSSGELLPGFDCLAGDLILVWRVREDSSRQWSTTAAGSGDL